MVPSLASADSSAPGSGLRILDFKAQGAQHPWIKAYALNDIYIYREREREREREVTSDSRHNPQYGVLGSLGQLDFPVRYI